MNQLTKNVISLAVSKMMTYRDFEIKDGTLYLIERQNGLIPESITIAGYEQTVLKLYNKKLEKENERCQK